MFLQMVNLDEKDKEKQLQLWERGITDIKQQLDVELYTDKKDIALEEELEKILDAQGIFYNKTETYIKSEKLYEVLYELEV